MAKIDEKYHKLLQHILDNGFDYLDPNRKNQGVYRRQIENYSFTYNLSNGFPVLTTKKIAWKSVVGELIWVLRGYTNIKYLVDNGIPIWNKDAYNMYVRNHHTIPASYEVWLRELKHGKNVSGNIGKTYGHQLRKFGFYNNGGDNYNLGFDQLQWLIDILKSNPMATKKKVTYWNPAEKEETALTPCHTDFSVTCRPTTREEKIVNPGVYHELSLGFTMESVDTFLGLPFNIAFYAALTHILAKMCNMKVGELRVNLNNVHIYHSHFDAVEEQLKRDINKYKSPNLIIDYDTEMMLNAFHTQKEYPLDKVLNQLEIKDFYLKDYQSYPSIKAEMLAYDS